jgi:hypothetical protein
VFPEAKLPFDSGQTWVDAKERLWVSQNQEAGRPPLYDLSDLRGRRTNGVRISARQRIVGTGAGVVYIATLEAEDLDHLTRHALPL